MKEDLQLFFDSRFRSEPDWIDKGRNLLIVAEIINKELLDLCYKYNLSIPDEVTPKFLGLIDSLMLLLGYSLENSIKGYIISLKPDYKDISELEQFKFDFKGHKIFDMIFFNIKNLTSIETELLGRLEQAVIWAGRYNSPKKYISIKNKFDEFSLPFKEMDFLNGKHLFERIEIEANKLWDKNEKYYLT